MNDPLQKLFQPILEDTLSAISSQELEAGALHCNSQDGQQTDLFGQAHAPASRSQAQESKKARQTKGTCGLSGTASLKSASRRLSSVSKLHPQKLSERSLRLLLLSRFKGVTTQQQTELQTNLSSKLALALPQGGLTMFIKGWKQKVTPLGRRYCQLAVSVRPTSAIDYSLWATTTVNDATGSQYQYGKNKKKILKLTGQVKAMWATPNTMDHMGDRSQEAMERQFATTRKGRTAPANLREQVNPAMWSAPREFMHKDAKTDRGKGNIGEVVHGLTAQTENKGSLNPVFPCWLMGYPTVWDDLGATATPLSRKSQRNL